jgi:hypothetical protein
MHRQESHLYHDCPCLMIKDLDWSRHGYGIIRITNYKHHSCPEIESPLLQETVPADIQTTPVCVAHHHGSIRTQPGTPISNSAVQSDRSPVAMSLIWTTPWLEPQSLSRSCIRERGMDRKITAKYIPVENPPDPVIPRLHQCLLTFELRRFRLVCFDFAHPRSVDIDTVSLAPGLWTLPHP